MTGLSTYDSLLLEYKPRPIRNEREYRRALGQVEQLMGRHGPHPPRAEGELIAVLALLIENYETTQISRQKPTPAAALEHLLEAKQVTKAEVARATGIPRSTMTNVVAGRRQISKENVSRVARYFHVEPSVFLPAGRQQAPLPRTAIGTAVGHHSDS